MPNLVRTNEALLRRAYAAFARGDVSQFWACCSDDFVLQIPGNNRMTGVYRGQDQFHQAVELLLTLAGGTRAAEVVGIRATEAGGEVEIVHQVRRAGRDVEIPVRHLCRIEDGRLVGVREQPHDLVSYDAVWA